MAINGAVDDSETFKREDVENTVRILCSSYSQIRRSFQRNKKQIISTLSQGDPTAAIRLLAGTYHLPNGLVQRVGYSAKIKSRASLHSEFDITCNMIVRCTIYFQNSKAELLDMPRYLFLHIAAHELAHAKMHVDRHALRTSEFATDVLALLVTGNSKEYAATMLNHHIRCGYIRPDLLDEVFRCLRHYAERIYL